MPTQHMHTLQARRLLTWPIAGLALTVTAVAIAVAAPPADDPPAANPPVVDVPAEPAGPDVARGRALLARFCAECHNEKTAKGKLNLAAVGHDPARPEFASAW